MLLLFDFPEAQRKTCFINFLLMTVNLTIYKIQIAVSVALRFFFFFVVVIVAKQIKFSTFTRDFNVENSQRATQVWWCQQPCVVCNSQLPTG